VTQAITLAGGVTLSAAVRDVQIRRRSTPGGEQVFTVNLGALLAGDLSQDVTLRDGDTIFIPTVATVDAAETRQLADASFASRDATPINVAVVGEVSRPGPYAVAGGTQGTGGATGAVTGAVTGAPGAAGGGGGDGGPPTLTKAIQVAGGITSQADIRSITIRRTTRAGEPRLISVNLWDLLRVGDVNQDVLLQEGDVITIPTATALDPQEANELGQASFAPNTIVVNVVGEVARPGAIPVPPNTPLNQAILAAGGFNNRARRGTVELVRLNPNGSASYRRDVTVDLASGINEGGNPILRNNDVVVVRRSTVAKVGDTLETLLRPVTNFLSIFTLFDTFGGGD
jgi:polysaccharide export outer membrane protein